MRYDPHMSRWRQTANGISLQMFQEGWLLSVTGHKQPKQWVKRTSEMSVTIHQLMWRHIPDDLKVIYVVLTINLLKNTTF